MKGTGPLVVGTGQLVEPLTVRELEVLRLLVAGLSNREIAAQLVLSLGTVKTHVHNIYGKLEVSNRGQAIQRATELELV
jgi:LuxR family maltose regulon positive regulatory protein